MSTSRDRRRCALQALYQFDASTADPIEDERALQIVRSSLDDSTGTQQTHDAGFALARAAWEMRARTDELVAVLTPDWPTYRQPVIDRNILRLACYEILAGETPPKVAINEAVELAKEFSTEKSPLFINGVLDKIYKSLRDDPTSGVSAPDDRDGTEDPDDSSAPQTMPDAAPANADEPPPAPEIRTMDDPAPPVEEPHR